METIEQKIEALKSKIAEIEARGSEQKKQKENATTPKPDVVAAIRKYAAEQNAKHLKK